MDADEDRRGRAREREEIRDRLDERIEDRLDRFSISVLGYDRDEDDPKPGVLLAWVREKRDREQQHRSRLGAIVTACATAIIGAVSWPLCQVLYQSFHH